MPIWFIKFVLPGIIIGLIIWAGIAWRKADIRGHEDRGYASCVADTKAANDAKEQETKAKQKALKKASGKVKDEIRKDLSGDRPVSPVIARQLERVRERQDRDE